MVSATLGLDVLKASVLGISLSATAYPFVAENNRSLLKILTISAIGLAVFFKQYSSQMDSLFEKIQRSPKISDFEKKKQIIVQKFLNCCPHITLSAWDVSTRLAVIHEQGHALTAKILFKNANPSIEIYPSGNGLTKLEGSQLSELGNKLGAEKSYLMFAAAGPAFATLFNLADLTIAHAARKSSPDLHKFLIASVVINTAKHAIYSLRVLCKSYDSDDFLIIWKIGKVHPIAASAIIVAIPAIYQLFLSKVFPEKKKILKNPLLHSFG